jgi:hypothetical protein
MHGVWARCMRNYGIDADIGSGAPPGSGPDDTAQVRVERLVTGGLFVAMRGERGNPTCVPLVMDATLFGQEGRDAPCFIGGAVADGARFIRPRAQ